MVPMETPKTTDVNDQLDVVDADEAIDQNGDQTHFEIGDQTDGRIAEEAGADSEFSAGIQEASSFEDLADSSDEDNSGSPIFPLAEDLRLEAKIEAIIFASPKPMRSTEIYEILLAQDRDGEEDEGQPTGETLEENDIDPVETAVTLKQVQETLDNLCEYYRDRCGGFHLAYIKRMGYQFQTVPAAAALMEKQFARRPRPISRAALETLSIIAYRQPCTRAEVEFVRGVDAGSIIHTLMERGMVACVGRKEIPGRPMLFGTTEEFLRTFQLGHVKDLPSLESFQPANDAIKAALDKLESGPESTDVEEFIGDDEYTEATSDGSDGVAVDGVAADRMALDPSVADAARELMLDATPQNEQLPARIIGASAYDVADTEIEMDTNDGTDSTDSLDLAAGEGDKEPSGELDS